MGGCITGHMIFLLKRRRSEEKEDRGEDLWVSL
jgi:hypothetical protein